jgi:hypothetical protein
MMMTQNHIFFTVTRQVRSIDGLSVVEISQGRKEYVNPDAIVQKFPGEFEEYVGMEAAVKAAIEIAQSWKKDVGRKKHIYIGVGCTHGMSVPFDVEPANEKTFRRLLKEAKAFDEKLPKCVRCGDFLTNESYRNDFCEFCVRDDYYERIRELNE